MGKKILFATVLTVSSIALILACSEKQPAAPEVEMKSTISSLAEEGVAGGGHWGYGEENGPGHWCDLDPHFELCCDGITQSPVDISFKDIRYKRVPKLRFRYGATEVEVEHNGHSIEAKIPEDANLHIKIGGKKFKLLQFHFHWPSEHMVLGKELPMEMHLVHKADDGTLAVVGVFIIVGHKHSELNKIWQHLPQHEGDHFAEHNFRVGKLLPRWYGTLRYQGSLTTPPCSESVNWIVLTTPIHMSMAQIEAFRDVFSGEEFPHGNRRPIQPLNGRRVIFERGRHSMVWGNDNLLSGGTSQPDDILFFNSP